MNINFITDEQLYKQVMEPVASATSFVWIGNCSREFISSTLLLYGKFAYTGSANLTGAGPGIKSANTRNFESGFVTTSLKFNCFPIQQKSLFS